jgi:dCMP deaminase
MTILQNDRLSRERWAMEIAQTTALRSTCLRRQVGAVLLDARGHVLSTGYNGVAGGEAHCNDYEVYSSPQRTEEKYPESHTVYPHACPGAFSPSGTNLDGCQAIHAEQNALLQCRNPHEIDAIYCTASPCMTCTKLLMNTSCRLVYYEEAYPHQAAAEKLWLANPDGRRLPWFRLDLGNEE